MPTDIGFDPQRPVDTQWWLARLGDMLVWAQLRLSASGVAFVFDCDGNLVPYDSEDSARAALLDAEYRAFDGLDEADADALGFDLGSVQPPQADDDAALRERMFTKVSRQQ